MDATKVTGWVSCEYCGERHVAEYAGKSRFSDESVYVVVCTKDWFEDRYLEEVVSFN